MRKTLSISGTNLETDMKPKIFIIGFNKTATRSLHYFFKGNGLLSVHWDNSYLVKCFERNIVLGKKLLTDGVVHNTRFNSKGRYEDMVVFSDMTNGKTSQESMHYYKRLDLDYPNSKFILNIRGVDGWIRSRFRHSRGKLYRNHLEFFGLGDTESGRNKLKQIYKKMHENHHRDVLEYFKNRKNDLLIFDIQHDDIDKVIKFLDGVYELKPCYYGKMLWRRSRFKKSNRFGK